MLTDGTTISSLSWPSSFTARKASFSHAMITSPIPRCVNVVVDPRAPESSTGTFLYSRVTKSRALPSSPLLCRRA